MQGCASNHPVHLWKGLGTRDAFLHVAHTSQSALDIGPETRLVQINFRLLLTGWTLSNRVDTVDPVRAAIQCCFCQGGIPSRNSLQTLLCGGLGFSAVRSDTVSLYNQSQYVMVDGRHSKLVIVVLGVPQVSVLGL